MPLTPKQRQIVERGQAACAQCGAIAAQMRQIGFPDEQLEERQAANQKLWENAQSIIQEHDAQQQQRGKRGK